MIMLNGTEITATIFPDQTSQVWHIPEEAFRPGNNAIYWRFEFEAELIHVCQLSTLLAKRGSYHTLYMPYLPYARQDKEVSNEETFALHTFANILNSFSFDSISFVDGHSQVAFDKVFEAVNIFPYREIRNAMEAIGEYVIAYPDLGAYDRYQKVLNELDPIIGKKKRDKETGYISHYEIIGDPKDQNVLILDDICDGGMTFKLMAKDLLEAGAKSVNLYVTHGIFSKGLETLRDSGIERIFTLEGEVDAFDPNPIV